MATANMNSRDRYKYLVDAVDGRGFASIRELARICNVAEITVRRDIKFLESQGRLKTVHGGVVSLHGPEGRPRPPAETEANPDKKRAIAAAAAALIQPNDILFLDSGTTVQALARALPRDMPLTLVCCSLDTFESCRNYDNCDIILVGGMFSPDSTLFYGHESVEMLKKFRTRRAFFGATGCDIKLGVTCRYVNDVQLKQVALETSVEPILLVDSDKFGKVGSHFFSAPPVFASIITDWEIPDNRREDFASLGCNIVVAPAIP